MAERGGAVAALSARLREGRPLISAWCSIPEPTIAGLLAAEAGFDAVTLDMQHGAHDVDSIMRTIPVIAARASRPSPGCRSAASPPSRACSTPAPRR